MHPRHLLLIPGVVLLGRIIAPGGAVPAPVTRRLTEPVASLATVTGSQLFKDLGFAADSAGALDGMRAYRPPRTSAFHRRITMRLRVTDDGAVHAVSLGFQPSLPGGNRGIRIMLSHFIATIAPRVDSAPLSAFASQIENNLPVVSGTKFLSRDSAAALLQKQPSTTYLALRGQLMTGEELFRASELRVTRLIDGPDTMVVMTLASRGAHAAMGRLSDWVDTSHVDLLGGTMADVETSDLVTSLHLKLARRSGGEAVYDQENDRGVLRLRFDGSQRVSRVTFSMPEAGALELADTTESIATTLLVTVVGLVPHRDSIAALIRLGTFVLKQSGPNAVPGERVLALIRRTRNVAEYDLAYSSVRMTRAGTMKHPRILIAVGAPGSLTRATSRASTDSAAAMRRKMRDTPAANADPGALYRTKEPPMTEQRVKKP